jgi:hypothetical protein
MLELAQREVAGACDTPMLGGRVEVRGGISGLDFGELAFCQVQKPLAFVLAAHARGGFGRVQQPHPA